MTRDERRAATRTELLEAASTVFARRGFHAATLEDVAREAGYTTGAIREWTMEGRKPRRCRRSS